MEGSVIKRQKLEGGSQEDFSVALHQLGGWMDSLEAEVRPKVAGELTIEQLLQLAQQLENEVSYYPELWKFSLQKEKNSFDNANI